MRALIVALALAAPGCTTWLAWGTLDQDVVLAGTHRQAAKLGLALLTVPVDLTLALPVNVGLAIVLLRAR